MTIDEEYDARIADAEARTAAEARAHSENEAGVAAEARVRELEAERRSEE